MAWSLGIFTKVVNGIAFRAAVKAPEPVHAEFIFWLRFASAFRAVSVMSLRAFLFGDLPVNEYHASHI